jgi:hypothetical protein
MRDLFAYSFKTNLSLQQMHARLNEVGPWRWIERENDNWGDYIVARVLPDPDYGVVKIFYNPEDAELGNNVVNVSLESDQSDAKTRFASAREILFTRVLPSVGAREMVETGDYE